MSNKLITQKSFFTARRYFVTSSINLGNELQKAKPFSEVPCLTTFKLLSQSLPGGKYYKASLKDLHINFRAEFGNILKLPAMLGRPPLVFTYEAEEFEKVYRNEGVWPVRLGLDSLTYYRQEKRPDIYKEYLGLFPTSGKDWHDMRTIANPIMMQPKTVKLYCSQVDEIAKDFVQLMKRLRDDKNEMPADFQNYINTWSLESISAVALERRLHILDGTSKDPKALELITEIRNFFEKSFEYDGLPSIWKYYQTPGFKNLLNVYDKITEIVLFYIDQAIKDIENKKSTSDDQEDGILRKLIKVNKKAAVVMVSDMLLAGVDTTATASSNIFYCLAKNPEKQRKLRDEIMKILPDKSSKLTAESMMNLPYLRAVIKETMRICPVIAGTVRMVQKDVVLAGYVIPANTHVIMSSFAELLNPKQYPEPEKFIPERWLRESSQSSEACPHAKTANPFTYLPFGFGARMCIGKRIADLEMEVLVANVVRNFNIEWNYPDIEYKSTFLNIPTSDLKFKLTDL